VGGGGCEKLHVVANLSGAMRKRFPVKLTSVSIVDVTSATIPRMVRPSGAVVSHTSPTRTSPVGIFFLCGASRRNYTAKS
jgi:hypothetical protein